MNTNSCVGCKFLYTQGTGYSNYTWLETEVHCAKDKNKNLPADEPCDWDEARDNWDKTNASRCEIYAPGEKVCLDVDGYDGPADYTADQEAIDAICKHCGREPNGS